MIYNDVTLKLRNKIRRDLVILDGLSSVTDNHSAILHFHEDEEQQLFEECKTWRNVIKTYFRTSYDCYRITKVGRFEGIRPEVIKEDHVLFSVSMYNEPSWKDWFDNTGETDGYIQGRVGKIINERTCPNASKFTT